MNKNWPVSRITRLGLGVALFVVLALCLQVPVFENYYLCLGYVAMAVYLYSIGTVDGTIVGVAGVILYCVLTNGLRGMPGWALGNVVIGLMLGGWMACCRKGRQLHPTLAGTPSRLATYIISNLIVIVVSCCIGIGFVKSGVESMLYGQPIWARMVKNSYALVADIIMLVIAYPICMLLDKHIQSKLNYSPRRIPRCNWGEKAQRRFIGYGYKLKHNKVYTVYIKSLRGGKVGITISEWIPHRLTTITYADHEDYAKDWKRVRI